MPGILIGAAVLYIISLRFDPINVFQCDAYELFRQAVLHSINVEFVEIADQPRTNFIWRPVASPGSADPLSSGALGLWLSGFLTL